MNTEKWKVANEFGVRRWYVARLIGNISGDGSGYYYMSKPSANNDCVSDRGYTSSVADLLCYPRYRKQYLDRTQAWRPLDIHPDWRVWDGATKGNK